MIKIHVRKGHPLTFDGRPSDNIAASEAPDTLGVLPDQIPYIKPRLHVAVGDHVNIGSLLFTDKRRADLRFLSPGGGEILAINYGPRRTIREIVIKRAETEENERFERIDGSGLASLSPPTLIQKLADGGTLPLIRSLPFRDIVSGRLTPPAILVSLMPVDPFHPRPEVYLRDRADLFEFGLNVLKRLAPKVVVYTDEHSQHLLNGAGDSSVVVRQGVYPAADPGVILYHTRHDAAENTSWYIEGQDLLLLAESLRSGVYPIRRIVTLGGSLAPRQQHIDARMGTSIRRLLGTAPPPVGARIVAGSLFRGYPLDAGMHLGMYETAVNVVPEGNEKMFLGFIRPGFDRPTVSRTFLSSLRRGSLTVDCHMHGEERACINCHYCADICPVDILPQFAYKSILADEIEEALAHGLLDCVECGLCSYVCPSKIELSKALTLARAGYYKEQSA